MMLEILCPNCGQALRRDEKTWRCENGHCFDVARQGYVNLLPVTEKHSRHPGDTKEQVAARREFLDAGYYAPIAQLAAQQLAALAPKTVLDAGCGEGYYLSEIQKRLSGSDYYGVDISKDAVRFAATRNKNAVWLAGTAAHLPFPDDSFDCILSMFALTMGEEFLRVLRPGGHYLQLIAGAEHLMGLKNLIYPEILHREKQLHPQLPGFALEDSGELQFDFTLDTGRQIQNLLAMTPHFWRISKEGAAHAAEATHLSDTAVVVWNRYKAIER